MNNKDITNTGTGPLKNKQKGIKSILHIYYIL